MSEEMRVSVAEWMEGVRRTVDDDVVVRRRIDEMGTRNQVSTLSACLNEVWAAAFRNLVPKSVAIGQFKQWSWNRREKRLVDVRLNPQGFVVGPIYSRSSVYSFSDLMKMCGLDETKMMVDAAEAHVKSSSYRKKAAALKRLAKLKAMFAKDDKYLNAYEARISARSNGGSGDSFKQSIALGQHRVPARDGLKVCELSLVLERGLSVVATDGERGAVSHSVPVMNSLDSIWFFSVPAENWLQHIEVLEKLQAEMLKDTEDVMQGWRKELSGELLAMRVKKALFGNKGVQ